MKIKGIFNLFFFICLITSVNAQLSISLRPLSEQNFRVADLANVNIVHIGSTKEITLRGKVVDEQNNIVVIAHSSAFEISENKTLYSESDILFSDVELNESSVEGSFFNTYGSLPFGRYQVCVDIIEYETGTSLAYTCDEYYSRPVSLTSLLTPSDDEEIHTFFPLFTWLPPMPLINEYQYFYDFKLVEVLENQTPNEAIQKNIPIFFQEDLQTNYLSYPAFSQPLEVNSRYAWQIQTKFKLRNSGVDGNESLHSNSLGVSEVYTFYLTSIPTEIADECYVQLKDKPNGVLEKIENELNFIFYNSQGGYNKLQYQILDSDNNIVNYNIEYDVTSGFNKIKMVFKGVFPLQTHKEYLLKVTQANKEQYIKFIYFETNN